MAGKFDTFCHHAAAGLLFLRAGRYCCLGDFRFCNQLRIMWPGARQNYRQVGYVRV
jgi:hypothetical protein